MIKKRICAFVLMSAVIAGILPAYAYGEQGEEISASAQEEEIQSVSIADEKQNISSEDPQQYRATHRDDAEQIQPDEGKKRLEKYTNSVALFSNKTLKSIYTGKTYVLPSGKKITNGIDVSKWDDDISWSKVKKAGTDFAIIRCGYRGYETGTIFADEWYKSNMKYATWAGVHVGIYFYSQAVTEAEARKEAQYCINKAKGYKITAPIVMDLEYADDSKGHTGRLYDADLSKKKQTNICLAFCKEIEKAGYKPMVYANYTMLTYNMYASQVSKKYPIWLANYTTKSSYPGAYKCWQYSENGRVNGIDYPIDCNFGIGMSFEKAKK